MDGGPLIGYDGVKKTTRLPGLDKELAKIDKIYPLVVEAQRHP